MNISDQAIRRICSETIYKRSMEYFKKGRVHIRQRREDKISALVDGSSLYSVSIDFDKNGDIKDYFCTCPYFCTMDTCCKHIAAVLKTRQAELSSDLSAENDNDRIALALCRRYSAMAAEKKHLSLSIVLNINSFSEKSCRYSVSLKIGREKPEKLEKTDEFLESYINGTEFKLSRHTSVIPSECIFGRQETELLSILAEAYQNRAEGNSDYERRTADIPIGTETAKRIFELAELISCEIVFNSMHMPELRYIHDNPDIIVDISATDAGVDLSVPDRGVALLPDGTRFLHSGDIYITDPKWRSWYMPIYHILAAGDRTQISFNGSAKIEFARYILPYVKNRHGVVTDGVEEMVITEAPDFEIYLDARNGEISAVIKAKYGSIDIFLPDSPHDDSYIVVRNYELEKRILDYFSNFSLNGSTYLLKEEDKEYSFLFYDINELEKLGKVFYSDAFRSMRLDSLPPMTQRVSFSEKINLLEVNFESELSDSEILGILSSIEAKRPYYRLKNGSFFDLTGGGTEEYDILAGFGFGKEDVKNRKKALPLNYLLYASGLVSSGGILSDSDFDKRIKELNTIKPDIPEYLVSVLREYQTEGVTWLKQLSELGLGGILADDMGLGKTLQVIAFVMSEKKAEPSLIIAPSSLLYNWLNEINKFAPGARALIIDGTKKEREDKLADISGYDLVITSYPLLRRDISMYAELTFAYIFIDEAQYIKNSDTMNFKTVKKLKAGSRFALTGTPIENRLTDLWSVFDFVMSGYLDSRKKFSESFEKPIMKNDDVDAMRRLRYKTAPFILRRMKKEVLSELPEKIENTIYTDFEPEQKKLYQAYMLAAKREITQMKSVSENSMRILALIMRLRQICCHPGQLDEKYTGGSGKLNLLRALTVSAVGSGHRILIFSQFTKMLGIIRNMLEEESISCFYLDGKTSPSERAELAERFNSGESEVFLVSLRAGGTGLNLTGADMVIHYDPWWNPAVTEQATDRAYRIGQKKAVQVIRLAVRDSIEEKILKLQEKKQQLANELITTGGTLLSGLTKSEILDLLASE